MPVEGLEYALLIGAARLLVLAALSGGACVWDLRTRRIPNALTFPAAAAGLALALAEGGWPGGGWALAGLLAGGALFLPFVIFGYVGAGDLKLLAAAGSIPKPTRPNKKRSRSSAPAKLSRSKTPPPRGSKSMIRSAKSISFSPHSTPIRLCWNSTSSSDGTKWSWKKNKSFIPNTLATN